MSIISLNGLVNPRISLVVTIIPFVDLKRPLENLTPEIKIK